MENRSFVNDACMPIEGVQRIIEEITRGTEQAVVLSLAESKKKAEAILSEAAKQAEAQRCVIESRGELEAQRQTQRILAEARVRARREQMLAKEEMVQLSFQQARKTLSILVETRSVGGLAYPLILYRLIKESVIASGVTSLEVWVNQSDRALVSYEILNQIATEAGNAQGARISLAMSDEALICIGGAVVRSIDGKVSVDNTLEARLERSKNTLRILVAKALFDGK
jgi:V/A-type H+/Na+-transporting ATPase subunit E